MSEQATLRGGRELARAWEIGHETFRKFYQGKTKRPHPRQLAIYRAKFLELHPSGYVRVKGTDGQRGALERLMDVLPADPAQAERVLQALGELAARHGGERTDPLASLAAWLLRVLDAERAGEAGMPPPRPPPREPGDTE